MSTTTSIAGKTAAELQSQLKERQITCETLVEKTFQQIDQTDGQVNAFLSLQKETALQKAAEVDKLYDKGEELSPLAGIPISIKDNICIKDQTVTCGSKLLENYESLIDATVIEKLNQHCLICRLQPPKCNLHKEIYQ